MQIAIIAEPVLQDADQLWIEAVRSLHDPQHGRIGPHVTLVFPHPCADPEPVVRHALRVAARHAAITAHLRVALPTKDPLGAMTHVYLVPDEGFSALVRLHDDLYREALAGALRLDIPYMPHVTVAATEVTAAKAIADDLNRTNFNAVCRIDAVSVVRCDSEHPETLRRIALADSASLPPSLPL